MADFPNSQHNVWEAFVASVASELRAITDKKKQIAAHKIISEAIYSCKVNNILPHSHELQQVIAPECEVVCVKTSQNLEVAQVLPGSSADSTVTTDSVLKNDPVYLATSTFSELSSPIRPPADPSVASSSGTNISQADSAHSLSDPIYSSSVLPADPAKFVNGEQHVNQLTTLPNHKPSGNGLLVYQNQTTPVLPAEAAHFVNEVPPTTPVVQPHFLENLSQDTPLYNQVQQIQVMPENQIKTTPVPADSVQSAHIADLSNHVTPDVNLAYCSPRTSDMNLPAQQILPNGATYANGVHSNQFTGPVVFPHSSLNPADNSAPVAEIISNGHNNYAVVTPMTLNQNVLAESPPSLGKVDTSNSAGDFAQHSKMESADVLKSSSKKKKVDIHFRHAICCIRTI